MPRKKKTPDGTEFDAPEDGSALPMPDAATLLYKDRSGAPMSVTLTEGRANFETITNAARAVAAGVPTEPTDG